MVRAPSLREFKKHLDNALGHSVAVTAYPVQGPELDWMIPVGPFQLWIFYDSVISTQASILFMDTERSTHSLPATAPGHAASAPEGWKTCIDQWDSNLIP